ncbi:MAG: GNAT family N-acetyltransferase [Bacteroidota bacterium]|nr:GNAT family N-acetyltransferase [Bacteroidota bacterium]
MHFEAIKYKDLEELRNLQPDDWPDIIPDFEFYIESAFCHPIKTEVDEKIVGTGVSIVFGKTAWLSHIIVDQGHRNSGIGSGITDQLLSILKDQSVKSCLLLASEMGLHIYQDAGFRIVTEYTYLKRKGQWPGWPVSQSVIPYRPEYREEILKLDTEISGESRRSLLEDHLENSSVFIENSKVKGFYIPDIGEGLIFATNRDAGIELMKVKYSNMDKAVLPIDNTEGIEFLKQNGFVVSEKKGTRMIFGKDIDWKPQNIYSRIGGNFG